MSGSPGESATAATAIDGAAPRIGRSTLAVLTNTAATGVLGMGFWLLAAALYEPGIVATSVAASSLLIALSFAAQLNLATSLSRFLPGAAGGQRATLIQTYVTAVGAAALLAVLVLGVGVLRGGELIAGADTSLTIVTAVCLLAWVVFALQDAALVAVRRAHWLPVENGLTTIAKLLLLPALLFLPGNSAVLLAWSLPALPAIWFVNRALFRRGLLEPGRSAAVPRRQMLGYAGVDLVGTAAMILALRIVPVVVVEALDADTAAFVNVPWSILTVAAIALADLSRMMLAEMSHAGPAAADDVADRTTRLVVTIFVPGALVGAALTYPVLSLVGEGYARTGTPVIALGLVGLIPAAVVECRLARYRYLGQMSAAASRQVARAVLIFAGVVVALWAGRVEAIGAAFAVANAAALLFVGRPRATRGSG